MGATDPRLAKARDQLMSPREREEFVHSYGEAVRPLLDALLDRKAATLLDGYERSWRRAFASNEPDPSECVLLSEEEAARLVAIPVAAVKRLKMSR